MPQHGSALEAGAACGLAEAPLGDVLGGGGGAGPARLGAADHLTGAAELGVPGAALAVGASGVAAVEDAALLLLAAAVPSLAGTRRVALVHLPAGALARQAGAALLASDPRGDVAAAVLRALAAHHGEVPAHRVPLARTLDVLADGGAAARAHRVDVRVAAHLRVVVEAPGRVHDVGAIPADRPAQDARVADAAAEALLGALLDARSGGLATGELEAAGPRAGGGAVRPTGPDAAAHPTGLAGAAAERAVLAAVVAEERAVVPGQAVGRGAAPEEAAYVAAAVGAGHVHAPSRAEEA